MLNDAEGQGGGNVSDNARETVDDAVALFTELKRWIRTDYNSKGQVNWRREAREDFDFEAGEQTNEEDKAILQDAKRPIVMFNRVGTTVDSVAGQEVGNQRYGASLLARIVCLKYPDLFKNQKFSRSVRATSGRQQVPSPPGGGCVALAECHTGERAPAAALAGASTE